MSRIFKSTESKVICKINQTIFQISQDRWKLKAIYSYWGQRREVTSKKSQGIFTFQLSKDDLSFIFIQLEIPASNCYGILIDWPLNQIWRVPVYDFFLFRRRKCFLLTQLSSWLVNRQWLLGDRDIHIFELTI